MKKVSKSSIHRGAKNLANPSDISVLFVLTISFYTLVGGKKSRLLVSMMHDNGFGKNRAGGYVPSLMRYHAGWRDQTHKFGPQTKLVLLTGEYMTQAYGGLYYGKAQNLRPRLTAAYDKAFAEVDLLLMPTLPITAPPIPAADADATEIVARALEMIPNTPGFDLTGHPSISVPCGNVDGLPVGMMLTGRCFEESTVYRTAYALEQSL